jgi:hypothetical protein
MIKSELTLPEIGLIAGTRGMLGAGIALLLSDKLSAEQRRAVGWTLVGVGSLTTIPLAMNVFSKRSRSQIASTGDSDMPAISTYSDAY